MTTISPATPPTIPPASTRAGGILLPPPDPAPAVEVDEGDPAVFVAMPFPPPTIPFPPVPVAEADPDSEEDSAEDNENDDGNEVVVSRVVGDENGAVEVVESKAVSVDGCKVCEMDNSDEADSVGRELVDMAMMEFEEAVVAETEFEVESGEEDNVDEEDVNVEFELEPDLDVIAVGDVGDALAGRFDEDDGLMLLDNSVVRDGFEVGDVLEDAAGLCDDGVEGEDRTCWELPTAV